MHFLRQRLRRVPAIVTLCRLIILAPFPKRHQDRRGVASHKGFVWQFIVIRFLRVYWLEFVAEKYYTSSIDNRRDFGDTNYSTRM